MLKFNVTGDKLQLESYSLLNSGSYGYYTAEFTFDSDWDGLIPHLVVYENGVKRADEVIINGTHNIATTESGIMQISVYGLDTEGNKCISCNYVYIEIKQGGYNGIEPLPKDIWDGYQIIVLGYMGRAEAAAVDAKASAEAASQSEINTKKSEEAAVSAETAVKSYSKRAESAASNAEESERKSANSEKTAEQALSDLLEMVNSGDIILASDGKLPLSSIPATATQEIYTVTSENELTELIAQRGDLAELVEEINGERTITKVWQCLGDASLRENWIVWGTSYAVQSGNAAYADSAGNASMINGHRMVEMTEEAFENAVKDEDTYYLVY